jgi:hypothetical protein
VQPGEPEFLPEDTDLAIALAEEEADTCPSCGMLKVFCRDKDYQYAFRVVEEQCHATWALAANQAVNKERDDTTRRAIQTSVRFGSKVQPDLLAGLDLVEQEDQADQ